MIKNAHHFNEPGSEIYKVCSPIPSLPSLHQLAVSPLQMASTLRKFVINHCAELERRYHTVPK